MLNTTMNITLLRHANITSTLTVKNASTDDQTPYDILTTIIGAMALLLNGLLLIAMVRNASKIFTSNGAYLVANVTVADL